MSEVVQLDAASRAKKARGRRRSRSKTALVLGGGGFTGAVYEIGALRAFDLLAVNRTVNDFDVYVALIGGLINQHHANDPGGSRYAGLLRRALDMWSDSVDLPASPRSD